MRSYEAQPVSVEESEEAVSVDMGVAQAKQGVDEVDDEVPLREHGEMKGGRCQT